jgi:hypothetical protein
MLARAFRGRKKIPLATVRDLQREHGRMYGAWVRGEIDDSATRAGSLALDRLGNLMQGHLVDERLAEIEAKLASVKPNGASGRPEIRP